MRGMRRRAGGLSMWSRSVSFHRRGVGDGRAVRTCWSPPAASMRNGAVGSCPGRRSALAFDQPAIVGAAGQQKREEGDADHDALASSAANAFSQPVLQNASSVRTVHPSSRARAISHRFGTVRFANSPGAVLEHWAHTISHHTEMLTLHPRSCFHPANARVGWAVGRRPPSKHRCETHR